MSEATMHLRIGRLAVDAAALGGRSRAGFVTQLEGALARRLGDGAADGQDALVDAVAGEVAARIAASGAIPRGTLPAADGPQQ